MRVLVTGATGFIGSRATMLLHAQGHEVIPVARNLDSPAVEIAERSGLEPRRWVTPAQIRETLLAERPDVILHLATHYLKTHEHSDIPDLVTANVQFGAELLDAIPIDCTRLVYASSFFQFRQGDPHPMSLYAATKQAFSELVRYYEQGGLAVTETVLYDSYGPNDTRNKLIPLLISAAASGSAVQLGPSSQLINLTYVDDLCDGLFAAFHGEANPRTVAIRSQEPVTVGHIVATLEEASGRKLQASFRDVAPDNAATLAAGDWPAPSGWSAQVNLSEGLKRTLEATNAV